MLRAAVFDLDHTLFDPCTLPSGVFAELEERVRSAAADQVPAALVDAALADAWRLPFDRVIALHPLPQSVIDAWQMAACALEVKTPLVPYSDVLDGLRHLSLQRFLLTTGFRRLQESKVRQLGLRELFDAVYVDALDPPGPLGKGAHLRRLMLEHGLAASEVVVIGDRAEDELSAARALGMVAVQVIRPGVIASPDVPWQIADLRALPAVVGELTAAGSTLHQAKGK